MGEEKPQGDQSVRPATLVQVLSRLLGGSLPEREVGGGEVEEGRQSLDVYSSIATLVFGGILPNMINEENGGTISGQGRKVEKNEGREQWAEDIIRKGPMSSCPRAPAP